MPPDISVMMSLESMVYAMSAVRSAVERSEKFRLDHVLERQGDVRFNDATENHVYQTWSALEDLTKGFVASGRGSKDQTAQENRALWDLLQAGRAKLEWVGWNSSWVGMVHSAKRMGVVSQEEYEALQREGEQRLKTRAELSRVGIDCA